VGDRRTAAGSPRSREARSSADPGTGPRTIRRITPASGGSPVFVGPKLPENGLTDSSGGYALKFSPDGESLLVSYGFDGTTWLLPVSGAPGQQVPWTISRDEEGHGWQRLAP
jgi:hypothetical protein